MRLFSDGGIIMTASIGFSAYQSQISLYASKQNNGYSSIADSLTGYADITDTVDISAQSIASYSSMWVSNQLFGAAETVNGQYKTLDQIGSEFMDGLDSFSSLANSLFASAGINLNNSITLQADGLGNLQQVNESNPQSAEIENVVSTNNVMTSRFMIVAALGSIQHAAETDPEFVSDYNSDPAATMEKYEETLKQYMLGFQMTLSRGGVSYDYGDPIYGNSGNSSGSGSSSTATTKTTGITEVVA